MNALDTLIINNPDLSTLERAAYCTQSAEAWRAYCTALEETLDDMGNQRAEAERLDIEPREVGGVKVYPVDHWTAYA